MLPAVKDLRRATRSARRKTTGTGQYESQDGELPAVGDVIEIDEHGDRARVTDVWPDDNPPIRAELFAE